MKILTRLLVLTIFGFESFAQQAPIVLTADHYKILNVKKTYLNDIENLRRKYQEKIDLEQSKLPLNQAKINKLIIKRDAIVFNNKFLNQFFSGEISSFMTSVKDQSLEKYFLTSNTDEKTVSIGRNFDIRELSFKAEKRKQIKMSHIFTLYGKSNLDAGFSTVYSKNSRTNEFDLNSDVGVGIRYTYFCNGKINYYPSKALLINNIRSQIIFEYIDREIAANVGNNFEISQAIKNDLALLKIMEESENYNAKKNDYFNDKYVEYYNKISAKEIELIKLQKLYSSYRVGWYSIEYYQPLSRKDVLSTNDNIIIDTTAYRNWRIEASYNHLRNWSNGKSWKYKLSLSHYNTSNFIMDNKSPVTFQKIIQENFGNNVIGSGTPVFQGEYKEKNEISFRGEAAILFLNNSLGINSAIERNFNYGTYNWKLGLPFSLKDKEDKPTINFEVLWREINRVHVLGINASYVFGKFAK